MQQPWRFILDKLSGGIGVYVFVKFLVYHAYGRGAAACKAFNELDAVISVCAYRNWIMHSLSVYFTADSGRGAQVFH